MKYSLNSVEFNKSLEVLHYANYLVISKPDYIKSVVFLASS